MVIDEAGAKQVRHIFQRYLELGSVYELISELNGNLSKGGAPEDAETRSDDLRHPASARSRGMLYYLLSNPIYIGKIRHKGVIHDGEHEPIIDVKTFEEVQQKLKDQAASPRGSAIHPDTHTLTGLLFDDNGHRLTPVHTKCRGRRYRYYVSDHRLAMSGTASGWRIAAKVLEPIVEQQLNQILRNKTQLAQWIQQFAGVEKVGELLENASRLKEHIGNPDDNRLCNNLIRVVFKQVTLARHSIKYAVDVKMLIEILSSIRSTTNAEDIARTLADQSATRKRSAKAAGSIDGTIEVRQAIRLKQRGIETRIIIDGGAAPPSAPDQTLIDMMARAHLAMGALTDGSGRGMNEMATMLGLDRSDLSRILPLAFLAPKITEAILAGQQPPDLTLAKLTREIELPIDWQQQLERLAS